ncbi:CBS domain-containing protein [Roseibacterium sp. SDUM158017]|uniref:CBS domain-containing protein n=1 Tax=Roseicyclus salinarum TaxID=3036773 RepID=UPI0024158296|nr:CBS domain-containing protein [Roseibacterium sp. SDUM158017]MDG4647321.1 CBS domain-containing protein [Roseibacterium sp. SDUM158017]
MTEALKVRAGMETDIVRLSPGDPIRQAVAALVASGASAAPVVEADGALCGILTEKDCFRSVLHASYYQEWRGTVSEHLSRNVVTIEASEDMVRAAEVFLSLPHRVLPVLEDGKLAGMLNRSAVMAALLRES